MTISINPLRPDLYQEHPVCVAATSLVGSCVPCPPSHPYPGSRARTCLWVSRRWHQTPWLVQLCFVNRDLYDIAGIVVCFVESVSVCPMIYYYCTAQVSWRLYTKIPVAFKSALESPKEYGEQHNHLFTPGLLLLLLLLLLLFSCFRSSANPLKFTARVG